LGRGARLARRRRHARDARRAIVRSAFIVARGFDARFSTVIIIIIIQQQL